MRQVTTRSNDVANWPNVSPRPPAPVPAHARAQPFQNVSPATYQDAGAAWLDLFDGGENAANVPLDPLFLRARALDVVVALDTTAETTNGTKFNFPKCVSRRVCARGADADGAQRDGDPRVARAHQRAARGVAPGVPAGAGRLCGDGREPAADVLRVRPRALAAGVAARHLHPERAAGERRGPRHEVSARAGDAVVLC